MFIRRRPKPIPLSRSLIRYSLEFLINSGFHLGADSRKWFSPSSYYLVGNRKGVFLFDLTKSVFLLRRASSFIAKMGQRRGKILFLLGETYSRYVQLIKIIKSLGHLILVGRYKAGSISNYRVVSPTLSSLPSAIFLLDHFDSSYAIKEATSLRLPVIGISDSDMDPSFFTYPLPGNNDSLDSIRFLLYPILRGLARWKSIEAEVIRRENQRRIDQRLANNLKKKKFLSFFAASRLKKPRAGL